MKNTKRTRLEKQFWLDLSRYIQHLGYTCKWEIAGSMVSKQKVWNRIDQYHQNGIAPFYGLSVTLGRIGNHDLKLHLEMQKNLTIGLRFKEGFPYWTEQEIEKWGEITMHLDHLGGWKFDTTGWFATQSLPVKLNFKETHNSSALDMEFYGKESLVKLIINEEISTKIFQVRNANTTSKKKMYGTFNY